MNKYQNGKIYKLVCDNSPLVYYGSTCQKYLCNRLAVHKYNKDCNSSELFQLGKVTIHEIEKYSCNSRKELEDRERIYIEFILKNFDYKIICNKQIPSRSPAEYYTDNKESIRKRQDKKINCPCGAVFRQVGKPRHLKTKKHL